MTNLLCIESSTSICSVALANEGQLMGLEETEDKNAHSARLTVLIEKLLKDNNLKMSQLLLPKPYEIYPIFFDSVCVGLPKPRGILQFFLDWWLLLFC